MGNVIYLADRRAQRAAAPPPQRPTFFFDISSPLSYLMAERIERRLGEVDWVVVDAGRLRRLAGGSRAGGERLSNLRPRGERAEGQGLRARAEACARALRLPLVWPDRFPGSAPCALRACAFACELGAGGPFALAASRLAFCGGFDLEDPETLAEAAAAAGIPLDECLAAAGETWRDEELAETARRLAAHGIGELPAIRIGERWLAGESGLLAAESLLSEPGLRGRSLAPRR